MSDSAERLHFNLANLLEDFILLSDTVRNRRKLLFVGVVGHREYFATVRFDVTLQVVLLVRW